jgi:eukaryotic-like serine/threonine-protein kinase
VLGLSGDAKRAQAVAQDMSKSFPLHISIQSYWLPTVQAQIALSSKDPAGAIERLRAASSMELGLPLTNSLNSCLYPVYLRGEAYLAVGQGNLAAVEFRKILDHRGLVWNCATAALARLGLGRAYAMTGDKAKARAAYQDFLMLWKDADPDIPVLKQAKAEYAKLQ